MRRATLALFAVFFITPVAAMVEFSTRGRGLGAPRTLAAWSAIASYPELLQAILVSLELCALTCAGILVLVVPTLIWVRLRLPVLSKPIEMLSLLPLSIPGIVLVVGLAPIYRWISINLTDSALALAPAYLVLVLPFAYRSLDAGMGATDLRTLSEAARSLGAGWGTVMVRVLAPNLSSSILNACLLAVALVLGEFTIANLLSYTNLQVAIALLGRANAGVSIAVAVAGLLLAFVLLLVISFVEREGAKRPTRAGIDEVVA